MNYYLITLEGETDDIECICTLDKTQVSLFEHCEKHDYNFECGGCSMNNLCFFCRFRLQGYSYGKLKDYKGICVNEQYAECLMDRLRDFMEDELDD